MEGILSLIILWIQDSFKGQEKAVAIQMEWYSIQKKILLPLKHEPERRPKLTTFDF